jgi:hypothetical protein
VGTKYKMLRTSAGVSMPAAVVTDAVEHAGVKFTE